MEDRMVAKDTIPQLEQKLKQFTTGAVRGVEDSIARYDLITPIGLRRLAETYGEGAIKYNDENWLKGIDCRNLMNHAMTHINKYMAGDTSEDHLAHAAWNLFAIMHNEEKLPHMQNITTRKQLTATTTQCMHMHAFHLQDNTFHCPTCGTNYDVTK